MGNLDSHMQKNETGLLSYTIHKNQLRMGQLKMDLEHRLGTIKLLEENIGWTAFDINCGNIFLDPSPKAKENKSKNKQMGPN